MTLEDLIAVARGEEPADLLAARTPNWSTSSRARSTRPTLPSTMGGWWALATTEARQVVDLGGRFVCPGFIDAHVHLESSMVQPAEFARAVVPHGTTAVVCDPHEIANVLGLAGVRYILDASEGLPLQRLRHGPLLRAGDPHGDRRGRTHRRRHRGAPGPTSG